MKKYVRPREGRTLIVGSRLYGQREDRRQLYESAIGIDMLDGEGVDRVLNLEDPLPDDLGAFVHVECCSVLEHSRRPWLLAANLERLMLPDATIFLSVPFVWRVHDYPGDYWRFTTQGVRELFPAVEWASLRYCSDKLREDHYLKALEHDHHPYLPRTEVLGFGVKVLG